MTYCTCSCHKEEYRCEQCCDGRGCPKESWHGADAIIIFLRGAGYLDAANAIANLHTMDAALCGEKPRFFVENIEEKK